MFGKIEMWYSNIGFEAEAIPIDFLAYAPPIVFQSLVLAMLGYVFVHFYMRIRKGVPLISALSGGIVQASYVFFMFVLGFFIMLEKAIPASFEGHYSASYKATFTMPPALFEIFSSLSV